MANSELFLVKDNDEEEEVEFDVEKRHRPASEFHEKCQDTASSSSSSSSNDHNINIPDGQEEQEALEDQGDKKFEESNVKESSKERDNNINTIKNNKEKLSLGELKADEDDDDEDGFRTPTYLEHKIPVTTQCPPAPRKPKLLPSNKRARTFLQFEFDFSQEVDYLFSDLHRKLKKTRTQDP